VLLREALRGCNRVDDRDRSFHGQLIVDSDLLGELAVQCIHQALTGVDAAAGQQPVLLAGLLVPAQQHLVLPAEDCRNANARFGRHHAAEDPKPRTPRSLEGSSSTSTSSSSGIGSTTSWAILIPGSTTNGSMRSVFRRTTRSSPR